MFSMHDVKITDYMSEQQWQKMKAFAADKETPFLVINIGNIRNKYQQLRKGFDFAKIYYAVKANPNVDVLTLLRDLGSNFDIASIYELDKVMGLGVTVDRISFGNTIKKRKDVREFYRRGVRMFATDSEYDIRMLAEEAPGSRVYVRILTEGSQTADWPLSRKFGCQPDMAIDLLILAKKLGLEPYGVSFHVGSQQRDIGVWDAALAKVKYIFDWLLTEENIELKLINMGGGFPANYMDRTNEFEVYAHEITSFLRDDFGDDLPEIILEPGRSLVGDSGVIFSEVVLISRKDKTALNRWVYTDIGKFNGLIETLGEAIKYPVFCDRMGETEEVVLAGPTCDSLDIMYEDAKYEMPLSIEVGDRLYWVSTGAYTTSYSSVEFNGFPPLKTYTIDE